MNGPALLSCMLMRWKIAQGPVPLDRKSAAGLLMSFLSIYVDFMIAILNNISALVRYNHVVKELNL
jgi:hypothetical protein